VDVIGHHVGVFQGRCEQRLQLRERVQQVVRRQLCKGCAVVAVVVVVAAVVVAVMMMMMMMVAMGVVVAASVVVVVVMVVVVPAVVVPMITMTVIMIAFVGNFNADDVIDTKSHSFFLDCFIHWQDNTRK
jgi:hypothetical protein